MPRVTARRSANRSKRRPMERPRGAVDGPGPRRAPTPEMPFDQAAAAVLGSFQHALIDLFAAAPAEIRKAADVERAFGVNHLLGWQTYRIAHAENPLAAGAHIPPRVSLNKLLTAAARRRLPHGLIARVRETYESFERLVESEAGDREELEAMLSAFLPEEQRKQELASKQAAFRATSQLKGVASEADAGVMLFNLSPGGETVDRATLNCELGMRRVRPDAHIVLGSGDATTLDSQMLTIDGRPVDGPMGTLLPRFSTSPLPRVETHTLENMVYHRVAGQEVGLRSAVDLVTADRREAALPRYWHPGLPRVRGPAYACDSPVKRATLDVFLHADVFPGVAPELWVYDTVGRGSIRMIGDPEREYDRLSTHEAIRALPAGLAGARLPHIPRYLEMLGFVFDALGWDPSQFRAYRLDIHYPVYGAQYLMGFRIPDRPALD
jgi:hypothetical protein